MTRICCDLRRPEMRFEGHAGAGAPGQDPVCAAVSILMYTLLAALPAEGTRRELADGRCRVQGGDPAVYRVVAAGLRLLAEAYPENVVMEEET